MPNDETALGHGSRLIDDETRIFVVDEDTSLYEVVKMDFQITQNILRVIVKKVVV